MYKSEHVQRIWAMAWHIFLIKTNQNSVITHIHYVIIRIIYNASDGCKEKIQKKQTITRNHIPFEYNYNHQKKKNSNQTQIQPKNELI